MQLENRLCSPPTPVNKDQAAKNKNLKIKKYNNSTKKLHMTLFLLGLQKKSTSKQTHQFILWQPRHWISWKWLIFFMKCSWVYLFLTDKIRKSVRRWCALLFICLFKEHWYLLGTPKEWTINIITKKRYRQSSTRDPKPPSSSQCKGPLELWSGNWSHMPPLTSCMPQPDPTPQLGPRS